MRNLIGYELRKIFEKKKTIVFAILTILLCIGIFFARAYSKNTFNRLDDIKKSSSLLVGEITPEKIKSIEKMHEDFLNNPENLVEINGQMQVKPELMKEFELLEPILTLNNLNELQKSNIKDLENKLTDPNLNSNEKTYLEKNIAMLKEKGNLIIGFNLFYDFSEFFLSNMAAPILGFLIIFFLSPVFSSEYNTNMDALILSSKNGKNKIILSKLIASFIAVTCIFILVIVSYNLVNAIVFGLEGGSTSFSTLLHEPFIYFDSPYKFTMLQYFLLSLLISYLGCLGLGGFTLFVSSKVSNQLLSTMLTMTIFYIPLLIGGFLGSNTIFNNILKFSYIKTMEVRSLFYDFSATSIFGQVIMTKDIVIFVLIITTVLFGILSYNKFRKHEVSN